MKLPAFQYERPASLADALRLLAAEPGEAKLIAGGQSLVPVMAFRFASPGTLVDLADVPELRGISVDGHGVRIGAMTRWRDLELDRRLLEACPMVPAAVQHIAHYQIRNRGTIGGSLAHADPSAEMPGVVVACDAQLEIAGAEGVRIVDARDFFLGPLTTCLADDEVLQAVRFPPWPATRRWAFEEFSHRHGDFAYAGIAAFYDPGPNGTASNLHVGLIGATHVPRRLREVEQLLEGKRLDPETLAQAAALAESIVEPADDLHASADYRRSLVGVLVERALKTAAAMGDTA